ncbi:hypothetical protein Fmac_012358 [Flemingia macrophylla]|uniref:Uncharacterized protein n=1 Tax=Flemingia macrophylla TaxID=520843 RepID=A0ABD1MQ22_9FABA
MSHYTGKARKADACTVDEENKKMQQSTKVGSILCLRATGFAPFGVVYIDKDDVAKILSKKMIQSYLTYFGVYDSFDS